MNAVQQKKNIVVSRSLQSQLSQSKSNMTDMFDMSDITDVPKFEVPKKSEDLKNALVIIKSALNKANKTGIDLETASSLRLLLSVLSQTVDIALAYCYKNENNKNNKISSAQLSQIDFPTKDIIFGLWNLLIKVTEQAQQNGAYDTIEESGNLYDSIVIMGALLGSLSVYVDYREQVKLQAEQSSQLQTIQGDNITFDINADSDDEKLNKKPSLAK